jgi:CRP/FNR family transcriptional regulator, cyclic AMP receptor protein
MPRRQDTYLQHLASVPLFANLTKKDLQTIARVSTEETLPKGTVLTEQGQPGREAFVILEGEATVRKNGRKVATLGAGAPVGELALLNGGPRNATVMADSDLDVLVLTPNEFTTLVNDVPGLAAKLLKGLATRVLELDRKSY